MIKRGIIIASDYMETIPADKIQEIKDTPGTWIVELNRPTKCVFFACGASGQMLTAKEYCGQLNIAPWNDIESFLLGKIASMLNYNKDENVRKSMRAYYLLIDFKETGARIIKKPTLNELGVMDKRFAKLRVSKVKLTKEEDIHLSRNYRRLGRMLFTDKEFSTIPDGSKHDPADISGVEGFMARCAAKEEERAKIPKKKKEILMALVMPTKKNKELSDHMSDNDLTEKEKEEKESLDRKRSENPTISEKEVIMDPEKKKRKYKRKNKEPENQIAPTSPMMQQVTDLGTKTCSPSDAINEPSWKSYLKNRQYQYQLPVTLKQRKNIVRSNTRPGERQSLSSLPVARQGLLAQQPHLLAQNKKEIPKSTLSDVVSTSKVLSSPELISEKDFFNKGTVLEHMEDEEESSGEFSTCYEKDDEKLFSDIGNDSDEKTESDSVNSDSDTLF